MQYLVTRNIVQVIGKIWLPAITCAQEYTLSDSDLERYGISKDNPTRDQIEKWIATNTGDFQSIEDFSANIGENKILNWEKEESELTFNDCMFPLEESEI